MFYDTWRSPWLQCIAPRHTLPPQGVDFSSYSLHQLHCHAAERGAVVRQCAATPFRGCPRKAAWRFFRFDSTKGWDLGQYFESNPDTQVWAKHLP